ncbi:MAG: phosphatidate cytidylyltransferase, partial [Gallionellaceae bacterium]|nr:phosphatidate cytidylyltransferase [Gallionellaceae bacterium]
MLKQRIITASILALLLLAALFWLPAVAWDALIVVLVMQGASEWARLAQMSLRNAHLFWWLTLALMVGLFWIGEAHFRGYEWVYLMVYLAWAALWLGVVPFWMAMRWQVRHPLLLALTGWAVLVPTGLAMAQLRAYEPSPWLLLSFMALVWVADIAAYFFGRKYGKNKLAPNISPGKTWEGVMGAMATVSVCVLLAWAFSPYSHMLPLAPNLLLASCC